MTRLARRISALITVSILVAGCGEDQTETAEEAPQAPTEFEAVNDLLEVTGYEFTSVTLGSQEIPGILVEGDDEVLVVAKASVDDLDSGSLEDLVEEEFGVGGLGDAGLAEVECVNYLILGPEGDFQRSVAEVVCG